MARTYHAQARFDLAHFARDVILESKRATRSDCREARSSHRAMMGAVDQLGPDTLSATQLATIGRADRALVRWCGRRGR